jgi:hypothetical protein
MSRPALAVLALPALVLLARAPLPAQTPAAPPSAAAVAAAPLPAGATVRAAAAGSRVTGRVRRVGPDTLVLALGDGPDARLALAGVDTLWRQAGRATGRGAVIGAVVGGVTLASFGALSTPGDCAQGVECGLRTGEAALVGGAVGVAVGALLGAGFGSLKRTWRRVYP